MIEEVEGQHTKVEGSEEDAANGPSLFSYKGPVAGLKGLLTNKLASGIASVVSTIDRVSEMGTKRGEGGTEPIAIEKIYPCEDQPRQVFEPRALEELAQTLRSLGQAQAITVRRTSRGYEIISGERRFRAAKLAGLEVLDCVVKNCSAQEGRMYALVENMQRQDLLPIEEAHFLKKVLEENPEMSLEKMAKMLGTHKSTLSEKIQLTEIPEDLQPVLYAKGRTLTHRHWRVLSRITDGAVLRSTLTQALEHQLSVAELERVVTALGVKTAPRRKNLGVDSSQTAFFDKQSFVKREDGTFRIRALTVDPQKWPSDAKQKIISELEDLAQQLRATL